MVGVTCVGQQKTKAHYMLAFKLRQRCGFTLEDEATSRWLYNALKQRGAGLPEIETAGSSWKVAGGCTPTMESRTKTAVASRAMQHTENSWYVCTPPMFPTTIMFATNCAKTRECVIE